MRDYNMLLKELKGNVWLVEPYNKPIKINSYVCITPYNTKTKLWVGGMNIMLTIEEIIDQRLPIVVKNNDKELQEFLEKNYPKES